MSDSRGEDPTDPSPSDRPHSPTAFCLTLLSDHDQAAAAGCPLLTEAGVRHLQQLLDGERTGMPPGRPAIEVPRWDAARRRLWLGTRVLKVFRQPAPHQTALLAAFQALGWAAGRIPDPLEREPGDDAGAARLRLHETVKNLNRGLPPGTVWFHVDGDKVWWERRDSAGGG